MSLPKLIATLSCIFVAIGPLLCQKISTKYYCAYDPKYESKDIRICKQNRNDKNTTNEISLIVDDIIDIVGIKKNFIISECAHLNNAVAINIEDKNHRINRYILYDKNFLNALSQGFGNEYWIAVGILSHEIAHHLNGDPLDNNSAPHEKELAADEFSGRILAKMGASFEQAQSATRAISSESGNNTHPPKVKRIEATIKGWNKSIKEISTEFNPPKINRVFLELNKFPGESSFGRYLHTLLVRDTTTSNITIGMVFEGGFNVGYFYRGAYIEFVNTLNYLFLKHRKSNKSFNQIYFSVNFDLDYTYINITTPPKYLEESISFLKKITTDYKFIEHEIEKVDTNLLTVNNFSKNIALRITQHSYSNILGPDRNIYGLPNLSNKSKGPVKKIIKEHYEGWIRLNNCKIIVSGNFDSISTMLSLRKNFGNWRGWDIPKIIIPSSKEANKSFPVLLLEDKNIASPIIASSFVFSLNRSCFDELYIEIIRKANVDRLNNFFKSDKIKPIQTHIDNTSTYRNLVIYSHLNPNANEKTIHNFYSQVSIALPAFTVNDFQFIKKQILMPIAHSGYSSKSINQMAFSVIKHGESDDYWEKQRSCIQNTTFDELLNVDMLTSSQLGRIDIIIGDPKNLSPLLKKLNYEFIILK